MFLKKEIFWLLAVVLVMFPLSGCSKASESVSGYSAESAPAAVSQNAGEKTGGAKTVVRLGAMKGPSALGLLGIMDKNSKKESRNIYKVTIESAPANIQAKLLNGELDIAALPVNLAAALYHKTEKSVSVIAVNTLGVLYLLSSNEEISSFEDVAGQTLYATGQGSTPEYVLDYLLEKNGVKDETDVLYKGEHSELSALMLAGKAQLAVLPEPFVTTVTQKDEKIRVVADLNDEWRKASGTELAMTCIVARNKFLESGANAVEKFLDEYQESTAFVNENAGEAAVLSGKYDIIPEAVAKVAIPKCNIVFIDGDGVKASIAPLLEVLFKANPQSVGGALPDDAFYYKRQG